MIFTKKRISTFRTTDGDNWLKQWNKDVLNACQLEYESSTIETAYGSTYIYHKNHKDNSKPALVFLPGFRTCGLFWDLNNTLQAFYENYRIYLIDVIGQPSLSNRQSPPIKTNDYAIWLEEILNQLSIEQCTLSGASFGGLLTLKASMYMPQRIQKACLFNPVGLQFINTDPLSMYRTLKPVLFPSLKNIEQLLFNSILDPQFKISATVRQYLLSYQHYVIKNFKFGSDYPYKMKDRELQNIKVPTYLFLCKDDRLIQQEKTDKRAKAIVPGYQKTFFYNNIGHGIELSHEAFSDFKSIL